MLTQKVERNWHQPVTVVAARNITNPPNPPGPTPGPHTPSPFLTRTLTGFGTISFHRGVCCLFYPAVPLSDTAAFSTLTITFSGGAPPGGVTVVLTTDTADADGAAVAGGATSITITKLANPRLFGGGGITGTVYLGVNLFINDHSQTWTPVLSHSRGNSLLRTSGDGRWNGTYRRQNTLPSKTVLFLVFWGHLRDCDGIGAQSRLPAL